MVSINTNLSSLIVQNNLQQSTNALNQAIERMTTGFKINHAADNAAGYSISQNMSSQISSYGVAQDNIASGMDMVTTAMDTITLMQSHGDRIMALWNQAQNGTYGDQSLQAIQSEVNARMAEIERLYNTTEYNGISLLGYDMPEWTQEVKANAGVNTENSVGAFIDDPYYYETIGGVKTRITDDTINGWTHVSEVTAETDFTYGDKYAVSTVEDLVNLAALINAGKNTYGVTFVMGDDIDLTAWCVEHSDSEGYGGWTPIGKDFANSIEGTFDGNGHKITGVKINPKEGQEKNKQGLFGYSAGTLRNVGVEDVEIKGNDYTGGLAGYSFGTIMNSYATGSVTGNNYTGGLAGDANDITNSYATGTVTGANYTGGLAGYTSEAITNSYVTGDVTGKMCTGGLVGLATKVITNSYATGNVTGGSAFTGGLVGNASKEITNSYATGHVTGNNYTGGLVGYASGAITNSYATGNVSGTEWAGGLVGYLYKTSGTLNINNILSSGTVSCDSKVGSLFGGIVNTSDGTSFSTINITNASAVSQGDMIGFEGKSDGTASPSGQMDSWLANISSLGKASTTLQVGINGDESCQITFSSKLNLDLNVSNIKSTKTYDSIKAFLDQLSERATQLGAVSNRLESALESTGVAMENLVSSRSTLRDADIANESSSYIKAQILQQASATLLATANQSPSIALQLI